jgi:glycosyltransferase involved in cell wall biosynthesis
MARSVAAEVGSVGPILMICPQFRPIVGGYERAAERLSGELTRRGVAVTVVTFRRERTWPAWEKVDGFEIIRLPCLPWRGLTTLTTTISLMLFLVWKGHTYAVWHAHAPNPEVAMAFMLSRMKNRPTVLKLPNSARDGIKASAQRGLLGRVGIARAGLRLASGVVVTSAEIFQEATAFFSDSAKIAHIPNGLDTAPFSPACPEGRAARLAAQSELGAKRLVVSVGRLDPQKNHSLLLRAWSLIPEPIRSEAQLAIIGGGQLKDMLLKEAQSLGISDSVSLPGQCDDVRKWYQAADVFVLSSDYEGLSNAMLEAMASGLPVVMTRVGGHEWVSAEPQCGLLTPVGEKEALAEAIGTLLSDPGLAKSLGRNARQRVVDRASIRSVAERTIALYQSLLGTRRLA